MVGVAGGAVDVGSMVARAVFVGRWAVLEGGKCWTRDVAVGTVTVLFVVVGIKVCRSTEGGAV